MSDLAMSKRIEVKSDVKKVFLTGAGGLIGSHFAEILQESESIDPVFLVSGLTNSGEKLSSEAVITKNLAKESSLDGLADEIYRRYGDIDVLVNNAAITTQNGIQTFANDTSDKRIQDVFQVNSIAALSLIRQFLVLPKPPSLIINILSRGAVAGGKRHVAYYASKAALLNASWSLAMEYSQTRFVCLMVSQIARKDHRGVSLDLIGKALIDQIDGTSNRKNFETVFFLKPIEYWRYLIGYCYNLFRNSRNYGIK